MKLTLEKHNVKIAVNGKKEYEVSFNPTRKFISGVTDLLKDFGILKEDKTFEEKRIGWSINDKTIELTI